MEGQALFDRQYASLREFCRLLGGASPDARVVERESVLAAVVPAAPDRSVVNSVVYDRVGDLERALPELAAIYEEADVRAWTVWAPAGDAEAVRALERSGHVLDADPEAMAMELAAFRAPRPTELDLDPSPDLTTVARLNDLSYAVGGNHFERSLRSAPSLHCYVARVDGRPVCCAAGHYHNGDFSVTLVATLPEARGRGLAGRLLTHALHDARERGCTTTSLQATKMGAGVYRMLGYRDLGAVQMWERRA
ncbi:MAG: GNAT family N-acetyltransferase [Solirubrobacterales bacterium]